MKTAIRIRTGRGAEALRAHVGRRLQASLARFASRLDHVSVRVWEADGASGERLYASRVEAELRPSGGLLVEEVVHADPYAAVDRSVDRLTGALQRTLGWSTEVPLTAVPPGGGPTSSWSATGG